MNNIKKILSMVLCLAMLLSMNASAFATGGTEEPATGDCGHNNFSVETTEATCDTAGLKTFACQTEGCDYSYTETVEATGHSYVDGVCSACGASENGGEEEEPSTDVSCDCSVKCVEGDVDTVCTVCAADYTACIAAPISALADRCAESEGCTLDAGHTGLCSDGTNYLNGTAVAKIGTSGFASLDDALAAASSMTGEVTVTISGKVTLKTDLSGSYSSIKFVGSGDAAEISIGTNIYYIRAIGKQVAFEGLTLSKANAMYGDGGQMGYAFGIYQANSVSYTNCYFANGAYAASANSVTFIGCTFLSSYDEYGLWTYGNVAFTVDGCVFKSVAGIKMFTEGGGQNVSATVGNTDFSELSDTEKPAIVMTNAKALTLLTENKYPTTNRIVRLEAGANGAAFSSTDPVTCFTKNSSGDYEASGVLVDGKIYITVAQAAEAAEYGSTVTLLHSTTEAVELPVGVTLVKGDYTADNVTIKQPVVKIGDRGYGSLQEAVDAAVDGDEIVFQSDITENVTVTQKENVKFTINGNGQTMKGSITVDGKSARYATAGVTIKNINFVYENIQGDAFVNLGVSGDTNTRYTNNVTVDSCTFSGSGDKPVGVKSYTGGDLNLTITNCTANAGTHSLVQVDNVEENLVITNNKVYSKNGMNLNATQGDILISNNIVSVKGYAVRTGATSGTATTPNIVLSGNTLTTDNSEGDAVVVVRSTTTGASITMSKNVVSGNVHISGNTTGTDITADANYWDGQKAPVVPEGGIKVSVASYYEDEDLTKLAKGDGAVAENNGQYYSDLQAAVDAAENGDTVVLLLLPQPMYDSLIISKNITLDLNKLTLSASAGLVNKPVVRVLGNVTITNGTIDGTPGQNSYAVIVGQGDTAGTLNIANGTYKGITSAISITNGTANISGGTFSTGHDGEGTDYGAQYLLNCIDDNYKNGKAVFNVTGGTFVGFNPQNNAAEGAGTKFTPLGYKGTEDANGNFIVEVDPEAFEAKIGGTNYLTIQAAVDAAAAGDEIVVLKEHAPTAPIVVEKNLTIDFANKKMECSGIYPVVRVQGGATLTVKNGNITNDDYVFVLGASDSSSAGNLNIESGTYHGATTVVSVTKGELNISGGSFSADPYNGGYDFLLNCYDPNRADCKITVKGGSFANFDPANNAAEGAGTNFVADNYVSVADGSNYTVKPLVTVTFNNAEMVRGNAQPSYTYSSNADVHGYTVEVTPAAITLNDNTSEYDINAATVVVKNGSTDVTANCKVEVTPGKLTVKTAAVKLTSGSTDTYYETLADAAAAAKDGDTITLQADNANDVSLSDNVTLALNGKSYTGTATVAEGKQLSMSLADLKTLTDGLKVKGEVKIGDTEIAMTDGTVKADASGNITATPTPAEDGFVGVGVNGVAILTKDGSVKVDSNGVASVSGYALVILADGSVAVLEKGGSVDKTGAITTTPAEVTNEDGKGVGYGAVTVISKDGKTQTGYLVPAGESLTLKLNSKNVLEPSTAKDVEDPIVDAGADFKNYLSVDPAKRSFYNKSYVSLTFTCNGFIDGLEKLEVRSSANSYAKVLTANECSVTQGSTVVKLKNSYLRTLALGTYTLTYTYADGQTAEATFHVVNTPLTGDFSNLAPFAAVMGFSIVALACVLVLLKKRKA